MIGFFGKIYLLSALCSAVFAVPTLEAQVVKRASGDTSGDPIDVWFDVTGWEGISEMNCYVMLCLGKGRVYSRTRTNINNNRRKAGADLTEGSPFKNSKSMSKRHTSRITNDATSAEEFPWASTHQGGGDGSGETLAYVMGAPESEQANQGGEVSKQYNAYGVRDGIWFRINLHGPLGYWCAALMENDYSKCNNDQSPQWLFGATAVLANFIYQYVRAGQTPFGFIHGAGPDRGKYTKRSEILNVHPVAQIEPDAR